MKQFFSGFFMRTAFLVLATAALPAVGIVFFTGLERNAMALQRAENDACEIMRSIVRIQHGFTEHALDLAASFAILENDSAEKRDLVSMGALPTRGITAGRFFIVKDESPQGAGNAEPHARPDTAAEAPALVTGHVAGSDPGMRALYHGIKLPGPDGGVVIAKLADLKAFAFISEKIAAWPGGRLYLADLQGEAVISLPFVDAADKEDVEALARAVASRREDSGSFYMRNGGSGDFVSYQRFFLHPSDNCVEETGPYAQAILAIPESSIQARVLAVHQKDILLLSLAVGGALTLAILIVYLLFFPSFKRMLHAAKAYAEGNFQERIPPNQPVKEFAELAVSLNTMAASLEKREGQLIKARELAEAACRNKSEFLATMSHEIRTPMNAIIGMAYLTLKSDLNIRQRSYLTKIYDAASTLLKIINDILELSKLDAGKLRLEQVPFAMRDIVVEVRRHVAMQAQEKGLELKFSISPGMPRYLLGDPVHLSQVLGHLLENAVRLTRQGTVSLECELEDGDQDTATVLIRITDTGPGMAPDRLASIARFFSGRGSSLLEKDNQRGGLGLLLVYRLVQAMNGTVAVESVQDRGTAFTLRIPFGQRADYSGVHQTLLSGVRALAVDDDPLTLGTFKELLDSFGLRTTVEQDAAKALEMVVQADRAGEPFHLVVLDWRMPRMDGLEFARRIRADASLCHSPALILLSAYAWEGLGLQAENAGIDAVLNKPINESVLLDTILTLLRPEYGQQPHPDKDLLGVKPQDLAGLTVLVADDNQVNQEIARELLEDAGISVTLADNGREALDLIVDAAEKPNPPFDIVFMDVQMPVMDGLEACSRLRALEAVWACDLPVIAMTVHIRPEEIEGFREAGFDGNVAKPISVSELFACIRRWLPVSPVRDPAVAARIRQLYEGLRQGDPECRKEFAAVEFMLGLHIHEGRFDKLVRLIREGNAAAAAGILERLNNVLGFR